MWLPNIFQAVSIVLELELTKKTWLWEMRVVGRIKFSMAHFWFYRILKFWQLFPMKMVKVRLLLPQNSDNGKLLKYLSTTTNNLVANPIGNPLTLLTYYPRFLSILRLKQQTKKLYYIFYWNGLNFLIWWMEQETEAWIHLPIKFDR